jgi:hypothetical protein
LLKLESWGINQKGDNMATIRIDVLDLSESMDELESSSLEIGKCKGIELVVEWLQSKERLHDFLGRKGEWCAKENPVHPENKWGKLASLLGRDSERFPVGD